MLAGEIAAKHSDLQQVCDESGLFEARPRSGGVYTSIRLYDRAR